MSAERTVLVTGASRGIGQAIALEFGKQGYQVIGTATSATGQDKIKHLFTDNNIQGYAFVCDVSNNESVTKLFNDIDQAVPEGVDVLVNNAGITRDNVFMRMSATEWDDVIDTNLSSVYRMCRASVKKMIKKRWGRIINVGSVVGATGNPGQANYCASKAGVTGFTKALAIEVGKRNITVNGIAPGFIATDMTDVLGQDQKDKLVESIPLARLGKPQEVAEVAVFLASDAAAYVSGQTIHVNGGMYMS